jgi:hypothetical protein
MGIAADRIDGAAAGGRAPDTLKALQDAVFGEFYAATGWKR